MLFLSSFLLIFMVADCHGICRRVARMMMDQLMESSRI